MKFIKFISPEHLNYMNIAVYQNGTRIKIRAENVVTGKSVGARDFSSLDDLGDWYESFPGSGLGRLDSAIKRIEVKSK
ncbi:hypothetical protein D3C76_1202000 [compost metagenome]